MSLIKAEKNNTICLLRPEIIIIIFRQEMFFCERGLHTKKCCYQDKYPRVHSPSDSEKEKNTRRIHLLIRIYSYHFLDRILSIPWPCTRKSFSKNISIYIRPKNSQFRNQKKKVAGDSIKDSLDFHASVFFLCASKICLVGHLLRNLIASVEQLLGTRLSFLRPAFFF